MQVGLRYEKPLYLKIDTRWRHIYSYNGILIKKFHTPYLTA